MYFPFMFFFFYISEVSWGIYKRQIKKFNHWARDILTFHGMGKAGTILIESYISHDAT